MMSRSGKATKSSSMSGRMFLLTGILLLPNDLQPGEQRPVVVCQHGLDGRPQDTADPRIESVYHSYAAQLADRHHCNAIF